MADFTKPLHTQSSDEIVALINQKIEALATLSLNDTSSWTNVPVGAVAFDAETNEFKRKTGENAWSTVQISLGIGSSLELDTLSTATLSAATMTLIADPTSNNQTITALTYKTLKDDVDFLKATSIDIVIGSEGDDFNISNDSDELNSLSITRTINLPSASETARGAVTTGVQTFAGIKKFSAGKLQLGTNATDTNNWHISNDTADTLKVLNGSAGAGTEVVTIKNSGTVIVKSPSTKTAYISLCGNNNTPSKELYLGQTADDQVWLYNRSNSHLSIGTNNTTRIIVKSDGDVGIGITNPAEKLDVAGTILATGFGIKDKNCTITTTNASNDFTFTADNTNSILLKAAQDIQIFTKTSGTFQNRVTITNLGNVGVGDVTPTAKLHVAGSTQIEDRLTLKATTPTVALIDQGTPNATNSAFLRTDSGTFYLLRGAKGSEEWTTNNTGYNPLEINLNTNATQLGGGLTLPNSSAKLGIGTTSPSDLLHLRGATPRIRLEDSDVSSTIYSAISANSTSGSITIQADPGAASPGGAKSQINFEVDGVTRMQLASGGFLGINLSVAPVDFIDILSGLPDLGIRINGVGSGNRPAIKLYNGGVLKNIIFSDNGAFAVGSGDALCLRSNTNGVYLAQNATSWSVISDLREKKNVKELEYGLEQIAALNPVRFDYIAEESETSARLGFIAQDVMEQIPEAVSGDPNIKLGLSVSDLIPALVNAIKELKERVEELESRLS